VSAPASRRWLFGPVPDLTFGCGLAYAAVFVAMSLAGDSFRELLPFAIAILPINLISSAHYGATALRAYERSEDRRTWALYSVWTTLLLGAGFVAGLHWEAVGSWYVTLYLTWSPWHYAGQNYGIAMTFLRRRDVEVSDRARTLLHRSFVLSFVLALLALHAVSPVASYAPNQLETGVYTFAPLGPLLGLPAGWANALMVVVGVLYVATTAGGIALVARKARVVDLLPALVLIGTQALWFSGPALARHFGVLAGIDPLSVAHAHYAFLWIGAGHAVQYLWITAYFAAAQGRSQSHTLFVTKALLAGAALWFVPALLFAPGLLGRLPYDEGLAAMVAALVNLHHFMLDGVIWKLREGRIARFLIGRKPEPVAGGASPAPAPVRAGLWIGGIACLALAAFSAAAPVFGFQKPLEAGDLAGAERGDALLERVGQGSAERRLQLGQAALVRGELARAERHLERSLELRPKPWTWVGLGDVHARRERWGAAAEAYARALELAPHHAVAMFHLGVTELRRNRPEEGYALLVRARELAAHDGDAPPGLIEAIDGVLSDLGGPPPR
jgi:tetratricopeptide (TPR) repeat protein